jgi:hypothetical protein
LLELGNFRSSTIDTLSYDFEAVMKENSISSDKVNLYRTFTLEKFHKSWQNSIKYLKSNLT